MCCQEEQRELRNAWLTLNELAVRARTFICLIYFCHDTSGRTAAIFVFTFPIKNHFTEHSVYSPLPVNTYQLASISISSHSHQWHSYLPLRGKRSGFSDLFIFSEWGDHLCLIPDVKIARQTRVSCWKINKCCWKAGERMLLEVLAPMGVKTHWFFCWNYHSPLARWCSICEASVSL